MLPFLDSSLYLNYLLWFEYSVPESPPVFPHLCVTLSEVGPRGMLKGPVLQWNTFAFPFSIHFPLAAGISPSSFLICPLLFATWISPTHFWACTTAITISHFTSLMLRDMRSPPNTSRSRWPTTLSRTACYLVPVPPSKVSWSRTCHFLFAYRLSFPYHSYPLTFFVLSSSGMF